MKMALCNDIAKSLGYSCSPVLRYSRASHNADFGDKKNQCILKTVYCGLLYRDIKKPYICEISAYTLYYKISVHRNFLESIENCVSEKYMLKEAMYNKALLYAQKSA